MSDDGPGTREVAYRVFAAEFDDASRATRSAPRTTSSRRPARA